MCMLLSPGLKTPRCEPRPLRLDRLAARTLVYGEPDSGNRGAMAVGLVFFRDTNGLRIELDYKLDGAGA